MHYDAGMGVELLTTRHKDQIAGVLSCYDRILIQGTLPGWCYAAGMTDYFYKHQLRIFDYPKWAEPLREELRQNMERIAAENGLKIEFVRTEELSQGGPGQADPEETRRAPGIGVDLLGHGAVHHLPAVARQDQADKTYLQPDDGKCLHYYFYFIDEELGLCYVRVPTWCPFRLQFYCNGHNWLARQLEPAEPRLHGCWTTPSTRSRIGQQAQSAGRQLGSVSAASQAGCVRPIDTAPS